MLRKTFVGAAMAGFLLASGGAVRATPSTTYWTPCIMDVQPEGVWHLTYDTYNTAKQGDDVLKEDVGLTYGFALSEQVKGEIGFDLFSGVTYPLVFNAKIGVPEGKLSANSPGFGVGVFNMGTKSGVTDQNVIDVIVGKTFGPVRLHAGYYNGDDKLLVDALGNKEDDGFMAGFDYGFHPERDAEGTYNKYIIAGDYAGGDNALGGGGVGLYWYYNRNVSLLMGPVWFNEDAFNGDTKFTMQLDVNF